MMVPISPPAACANVTTLSPSWWTSSAVMLRPRTGPKTGSTVDSAVMMMPWMVIELPHHLASGRAGVWSVSVGMGFGPFGWGGTRGHGTIDRAGQRQGGVDAGEP